MQADDSGGAAQERRQIFVLCGLAILIIAGLLVYCETRSFAWDEGFHLLAAQLVLHGKRPYLDFFLAQTPLYAYWNAFWMRFFGDTWRTAHTFSTLMTGGAIGLTAQFVYSRFRDPIWRLPVAILAIIFLGLNTNVLQFGTIAQPYGVCLFAIVAAFRLALLAANRSGWKEAAGAGFFACAGPAASLLTAPMALVLFLWILLRNRAGNRISKGIAFLAAGIIPSLPLLWLFIHGPKQVIFGAIKFHLLYRQVEWEGSTIQNLEVLMSWLDSGHALLLILLALLGLFYIIARSEWPRELREQFYLCAVLAIVESGYLFIAKPTFPRYFIFAVPFLAALASIGFYMVSSLAISATRPWIPAVILAVIVAGGAVKDVHDNWDRYTWRNLGEVARKADQVTPKNGLLWADEFVYFLTRRTPPSGFEYDDTHKLKLSPQLSALLHIIPQDEVNQWIAKGKFDAISSCDDEDKLKEFGLPGPYKQVDTIQDCYVYWDVKRK